MVAETRMAFLLENGRRWGRKKLLSAGGTGLVGGMTRGIILLSASGAVIWRSWREKKRKNIIFKKNKVLGRKRKENTMTMPGLWK